MKITPLVFLFFLFITPGFALSPAEILDNPAHEARARALSKELRCLSCQGESIDESNAPFAHDVRGALRTQIAQGRSDKEIKAYLRDRYGDFILMRPPLGFSTALLWAIPVLALLIGGFVMARFYRRR